MAPRSRYDAARPPAPPRVTAGDVYAALTSDPWATDKLRLAYHKIFEQGAVRPGENENAHFRYVETSRARAEINDLGAWITERFGEPFAGAPKSTPFGYHGAVKYDGWIALFADLACSEGEEDLRKHFDEVVSKIAWNVPMTSRGTGAGASSGAAVVAPAASPAAVSPPSRTFSSLFRSIVSGTAAPSFTAPYVRPATAPTPPPAPPDLTEEVVLPPTPTPPRHRYTETREPMSAVVRRARKLAKSDLPVLLVGETGVGKEVMAQMIHKASPRADKRMVALNCAGITDSLAESELFGYKKGAFTGANADRAGLLEEASGGTLFLDEFGEMPPRVQGILLRALQEKKVRRVGDTVDKSVDVRIIAATNRDLDEAERSGRFRSDLVQRIEGGEPLVIPPLRERRDEIEPLAQKFLDEAAAKAGRSLAFSPDAMAALRAYSWPGNIRELRSVVERAAVLAEGDTIERGDLPKDVVSAGRHRVVATGGRPAPEPAPSDDDLDARRVKAEAEATSRRATSERRAEAARKDAVEGAKEVLVPPVAASVPAAPEAPMSTADKLRRLVGVAGTFGG